MAVSLEKLDSIQSLESKSSNVGTITIGPLNKHEGASVGQLFRTLLLQSIRGSAISGVRFDVLQHEFDVIPKVKEDVQQIIKNLKSIVLKTVGDRAYTITIKKQGPCVITGADIIWPGVDVLNPDQEICTYADDGVFTMECLVTTGYSYMMESEMSHHENTGNMILFGSTYSPVVNVSMDVVQISAGRNANLEELIITVETNGSVTPIDAVLQAAARMNTILRGVVRQEKTTVEKQDNTKLPFNPILLKPVSDLQLPARAQACIQHHHIIYIGDLVMKSEADLLSVPNVGQVSVNDIKNALASLGLSLDMIVTGWPVGGDVIRVLDEHGGRD